MNRATVVRGGHVLTMGPAGDLAGGAVAFAGGEVLAAGPFPEVSAHFPDAEVVGDDDGVVLPGLVNGHTHLSEALLCGMGEDLSLFEWGERLVAPAGRHLTREMARVGAMLKGPSCCCPGPPASTTCSATPTWARGGPGPAPGRAHRLPGAVQAGRRGPPAGRPARPGQRPRPPPAGRLLRLARGRGRRLGGRGPPRRRWGAGRPRPGLAGRGQPALATELVTRAGRGGRSRLAAPAG